jgi:hypothetical protein
MPEANMHLDKRVYPRFSVKLPIQFNVVEDEKKIPGAEKKAGNGGNTHTLDVSLGGMNISLDQPLKLGTIVRVDFSLPESPDPEPLTFFAEVAWASPKGAGLQFIMVNSDNEEKLKSYLEKVSTKQ